LACCASLVLILIGLPLSVRVDHSFTSPGNAKRQRRFSILYGKANGSVERGRHLVVLQDDLHGKLDTPPDVLLPDLVRLLLPIWPPCQVLSAHDREDRFIQGTQSLKAVESKLDKLGASDERIQRLQRINGVGPRLAETVVAFLDDPKRFKNGKRVGSYAGLVPRQYQSGQMERQGRTGGRGNKMLRNLLVEVCWASLNSNPWARDTYHRLLRGTPSRKKIAITALARKLVVRCWAMLRDEQDWKDHIPKRVA